MPGVPDTYLEAFGACRGFPASQVFVLAAASAL